MPEMCSKIYMIDASWAMRTAWEHFTNYMKTYKNRMELLGPDWRTTITSMLDKTAMASIYNLRQQFHDIRNNTSALGLGREGEVGIMSGSDYEVAIEIDPEEIAGLRWSWFSTFERDLTFGVTIVREIDDMDRLSAAELRSLQIASITKRRDQVLHGLGFQHSKTHAVRLRRVQIVRDHSCCEHRGSYEWESPSSGLILLRWTLPPTSWYSCANMVTIEYNVEVVSKDATILTTLGKVRNDASKKESAMQPTQSDCRHIFRFRNLECQRMRSTTDGSLT